MSALLNGVWRIHVGPIGFLSIFRGTITSKITEPGVAFLDKEIVPDATTPQHFSVRLVYEY